MRSVAFRKRLRKMKKKRRETMMELGLKNEFYEMNTRELMETEGGFIGIIIAGVARTIIWGAVCEDLKNCYENAYDEVYYSHTKK